MREKKIIEIISSPEGSPEPIQMPPRTRSGKQRAPPVPDGDVIELTDSEDDKRVQPPPAKRANPPRRVKAPVAGPSRVNKEPIEVKDNPPPLFFPDPEDDAVAPPVQRVATPPPAAPPPLDQPVPWLQAPPAAPVPAEPVPLLEPDPDPFVPAPAGAPGSLLEVKVDPLDGYITQVLEIIPDVRTSYVLELVERLLPTHGEGVVENVLHTIFENPLYPREDKKGKGKRKHDETEAAEGDAEARARASPKPRVDYGNKDRQRPAGLHYTLHALEQLYTDFPQIPVSHVRAAWAHHNGLYAPTHLFLREEAKHPELPYKRKHAGRSAKGKGVARTDEELEKEKAWLALRLQDAEGSAGPAPTEEHEDEGEIECGCCFTSYPFDKMVQCPEAHLFCMDCMTSYASTLLGSHDAHIVCMDQSGCKFPFPESELRRFLTPKLLALYERVKQQKEIAAAGLEGLEECPFCEYKVVIDNDQERLFRCESEDCGAVTCRACKKLDHLPKSCKEVEDDKKLDVRHAIEEAMTRALMRNCPNCQKAFVKEMGCNKMTCPNCRTLSCYVCRKIITGYDHFNNPPPYNGKQDANKCTLWDSSVEGRHSDEVTAAAKRAMEEFKEAHPELSEEDLKVDLPPPAAGPSNPAHGQQVPRGVPHVQVPPVHFAPALPQAFPQAIMQQHMAAIYNVHLNIGQQMLPLPAIHAPMVHAPPVQLPVHVRAPAVPPPRVRQRGNRRKR
ncbi:hypothetical protein B0H21DRAFT_511019 [Amylocystis lapponica]|nr:hypothetical protein B0H21DRAFT_511019 [Amylocystis lapponica]